MVLPSRSWIRSISEALILPMRIAAQIVTGVGFLGAGTILQSRGAVHGLTTAAGLWVAAAIGIAVGAGSYVAAMLTTVALLIILTLLRPLENHLLRNHIHTVVLQLARGQKISQVMEVIEDSAIETAGIEISRGPHPAVTIKVRGAENEALRLIQAAALHGLNAVEEGSPTRAAFHGPPSPPPPPTSPLA